MDQEIRPSFDSRVEFGFQLQFQNQILFETWFWFQLENSNLILAQFRVTRNTHNWPNQVTTQPWW
jgi:hypothetical protein